MNKQIWLTEAGTPTFVGSDMDQAKNVTGYLAEMTDNSQTGGCTWDDPAAQGYPDADWDVTFIWYMWPDDPQNPHTGLITDRTTFNRRPAFYCLKAFARGHIPGTFSFDASGNLVTYLGWLIPWGTPLTLLGDPVVVRGTSDAVVARRGGPPGAHVRRSGGPRRGRSGPSIAVRRARRCPEGQELGFPRGRSQPAE